VKILITGASGLLGLNLALETAGTHAVYGLVNQHRLNTAAFNVIQADLLAPGRIEQVIEQIQPDWVINCAALANVDECETHPDLAWRINAEFPAVLAGLCAQQAHVSTGGARLIHVSTDAVFDGQRGGYVEDDSPNPLGVYARTKLAGERAVAEANPEAIIARVNLFGWSLSGRRSLGEFFFNQLSAGKRVMGFTDVFFCPLLVNDLADIFTRMLTLGLRGLYHVVSGDCASKYHFGVAIARQFGLDETLITPVLVAQAGLKAVRSPNLTLHTGLLSTALQEPLPTLSQSIHRFYQLYQQGYPQSLWKMGPTREQQAA